MKLLLFADGEVGSRISQHCIVAYPEDLVAVVTTGENDIAQAARASGVRVLVHNNRSSIVEMINRADVDLGFLAWWPNIVRPEILALARHGFINTHPSLLPHNRGKHYNFWALVEGRPFGVTLHKVVKEIDAGDIVAQRSIATDWTDTGESLYNKARRAIVDLFVDTYPRLRNGRITAVPQDLLSGSFHFASELEPASVIDLDTPTTARQLLNRLRARTFRPHPACRFQTESGTYEVTVDITRLES